MQYHSQDKLRLINWNQFLMLSQTFCYWDKQQSADSNTIQFHLTLKCTQDQSLFLSFEMSFSTLQPLSDYISRRIWATRSVCRHKQL